MKKYVSTTSYTPVSEAKTDVKSPSVKRMEEGLMGMSGKVSWRVCEEGRMWCEKESRNGWKVVEFEEVIWGEDVRWR